MKNQQTPAGIEPATFRFVAQRLSHCATAVPRKLLEWLFKSYCEEYMVQHKKRDAGVPDGTVNCAVDTVSQTSWGTFKSED